MPAEAASEFVVVDLVGLQVIQGVPGRGLFRFLLVQAGAEPEGLAPNQILDERLQRCLIIA